MADRNCFFFVEFNNLIRLVDMSLDLIGIPYDFSFLHLCFIHFLFISYTNTHFLDIPEEQILIHSPFMEL